MKAHTLALDGLNVESFATLPARGQACSTDPDPVGDTSPDSACSGVICTYRCPLTGTTAD